MNVPPPQGRSFPGPWHVSEQGKSFRVLDAAGFPVCHIYYDLDTTSWHPYLPSREQAAELAYRIAELPELQDAFARHNT